MDRRRALVSDVPGPRARLAQWNAQYCAVWFRFLIWTGSQQLASSPTSQEIADADFEAI